MKKSLVLAICLLTVVSLFADGFLDSFRDSRNYIPDNILLMTGNDKFNYGISRNDDDQLSYSFDFKVESPLWYLQFDANGFVRFTRMDFYNQTWCGCEFSLANKPKDI